MLNFKIIHRLTLNCKEEVKSAQKQPSCEKSGVALKTWVKKVGKSKVAAKNGCNDVNTNNDCGIIVKIY